MILYLLFFFCLGLALGSFGNVCIYRIPRDESVCTPRSHCPSCNQPIRWYDNIPLLSFILLGRKCRGCGYPISWQYPLFELLSGLSFLLVAWRYAFQPVLPLYLFFTFVLIVVSGIDFFHQVIPDIFSLLLVLTGLGFSFFNAYLGDSWKLRFLHSFLGLIAGGGILLLVSSLGEKLLKKEVMGGGDVKLLAGIGAVMGIWQILPVLFLASLIGSIFGITLIVSRKMTRQDYLPFGPFLALAAYLSLFIHGFWKMCLISS